MTDYVFSNGAHASNHTKKFDDALTKFYQDLDSRLSSYKDPFKVTIPHELEWKLAEITDKLTDIGWSVIPVDRDIRSFPKTHIIQIGIPGLNKVKNDWTNMSLK